MSLLRRGRPAPVVEQRERTAIASSGGWFYTPDESGSNPMRSVAHAAARRVLCTAVASLPVQTITESGGVRRRVPDPLIVRAPSAQVDQQAWVYQIVDSWLDVGNVYGDIVATDSLGRPTQVEILPAGSVSWSPVDGMLTPFVGGVRRSVWPRGDLWHVAYLPQAGTPLGASPSALAAQSVRTAIAAERFGGDFFVQGAHPTHVVKSKSPLNEQQAKDIKSAVARLVGSREPAVFGADLDFQQMSVNPSDSQFIDLLRFECEQAARIYGVPPQMIYAATSGQSVTYANASQTDLSFLKWSLRWPLRRLQFAWSAFLPSPQVVRLNVDALLETTSKERAELHKLRLETKTRTVNEVRVIEDEPPFDDPMFDEPGIPGVDPAAVDMANPDMPGADDMTPDGGAADD